MEKSEFSQLIIVSCQIILALLLQSWGINANAMIGHSLGEFSALYLSGILTLQDILWITYQRGKCMFNYSREEVLMVSIRLTLDKVQELITEIPLLQITTINSPTNIVVSGPTSSIETLEKQMKGKNIEFKRVTVNSAFHSQQMKEASTKLGEILNSKELNVSNFTIPMISTLTGKLLSSNDIKPIYFTSQIMNTVLFYDAIKQAIQYHLSDKSQIIFLEISSHPILSQAIQECNSNTKKRNKLE